jgi:hypothetical protein
MANQLSTDNGIIRLYDGTIVYIDATQYSHSGTGDWEEPPFNPDIHNNTITGIGTLPGHKYRRTKLAGQTQWQKPEYIVAEDGSNIELRVEGEYIQWKSTTDDTWTNLLLLDSIKGSDGLQGIPGTGLQVTGYFAFDNKPTCTSTITNNSGCGGCGGSTGNIGIYVSVGNHILNDTEDTGTYFSTDGIGWTLYNSTNHSGIIIPYWGATDNTGTGAFTVRGVNIVQANTNGIDTTGIAYICIDSRWVRYINLAANDHKIAETDGSTNIGSLSQFVTDYGTATITGIETIGIANGKLEIIDESITTDKFEPSVFNDGLENTGTEINVKISELIGFGIKEETTGLTPNNNIAVDTIAIAGNGLQADPIGQNGDGKLILKLSDIIISSTDGLETYIDTNDNYTNIRVNAGDAIELDANGVNVKADELSIEADELSAIRVKTYLPDGGNSGILATHLNPTVVHTLGGLEQDATSKGLKVKVDPSLPITVTTGNLDVRSYGIQATHLSNHATLGVADTAKAMKLDAGTNKLQVKYDNVSIGVNGSGELEIKAIDISDIPTIPLTKLEEYQTVRGDIMYYDGTNWARLPRGNDNQVLRSTATSIAWEDDQVIPNLQDTQFSYLQGEPDDNTALSERLDKTVVIEGGEGIVVTGTYPNFLIENNIAEQSVAWGEITGSNVLNQTDLAVYLNKITEKDTTYGNMKIVTTGQTGGLYIRLGSGNTGRRLAADDAGNLFLDTNTVNMT